jgi:hypothetical protein
MHDNDDPSIRQKPIYENHNELNKIIHWLVPRKNEGKRHETCGIERLDGTYVRTRLTLFLKDTWKTQVFTRRIRPNECRKNSRSIQLTSKKKKIV